MGTLCVSDCGEASHVCCSVLVLVLVFKEIVL